MNKLRAYRNHVARCRHKTDTLGQPVLMKLTFEQWSQLWDASGHWVNRGNRAGQYCMSRMNDIGHYELGNVFIQLHSENSQQINHIGQNPSMGFEGKLHTPSAKQKNSIKNRGSNNMTAKLTEDQVRDIKIALLQGTNHRTLADAYHVTKPTISAIATGRNWRHVTI